LKQELGRRRQASNGTDMGKREDSSGMTFARTKKREVKDKLPTQVDGTWHKAVALVENGGNDGDLGSVGRMASEEFLVSYIFSLMLNIRG
jgi:hypothetical protein